MARRLKRPASDWLLLFLCAFEVSGFGLVAFYDGFSPFALLLCGLMPVLLVAQVLGLGRLFPHMDQQTLIIGNFLCALGLILLCRLRPDKALRQFFFYLIGVGCMLAMTFFVAKARNKRALRWPVMLLAVGSLGLTLLVGEETYGAKNWIDLGVFSLQPSEFVKLALVYVFAIYLSERRALRGNLPALAFAGVCLLLIVLQKDLGAVLICFVLCLFMYYAATGNLLLCSLAVVAACGGAVLMYLLFDHVQLRVAMWQNPWVSPTEGGYQIIQALVAIGSGGMAGLGLGLGSPTTIPVYDTDFIFAALCEEMGILVGLMVLLVYVLLFLRAGLLALRSRSALDSLLCVGVLASLSSQTFLIVGGVVKMIPLTGVTLPFISYGGSSLLSSMLMLGVLQGVSINAGRREESAWLRAHGREEAET